MRLFLLAGLLSIASCQSEDDSALHFADLQNGRAVWIVDKDTLPWVGSYQYLSSTVSQQTVLMTIVDSSTGRTLGECSTMNAEGNHWIRFQWILTLDSLQCTVTPTNSSRILFPESPNPRTFSVRIQAARGPACMRDMMIQNERPQGCPPHLARNSFSSLFLNCSCPFDPESQEEGQEEGPQFPIFELGGGDGVASGTDGEISPTNAPATQETPAWTLSPCATHHCKHNGTCVVTQEGTATCLCRNGYLGALCEVDICATVPCQNEGICRANGPEAYCQCVPGYTGLLCESVIASCEPSCTNGQCILTNGTAHCECTQGFIGPNCNVIDVCLGDASCTMFGDEARCVLDASNYATISSTLVNATYDCRCPHPVDGQYVDCLSLHLSSSTATSMATILPTILPSSVDFINGQPSLLPTTKKRILEEEVEESTVSVIPTMSQEIPPRPTFSIHPNIPNIASTMGGVEELVTTTISSRIGQWTPHGVQTQPSIDRFSQQETSAVPSVIPAVQPSFPSTFVFPQTPEAHTQSTSREDETHTMFPIESSFPTPSPMDISAIINPSTSHTVQPTHFNPFNSHISTQQPMVVVTTEQATSTEEIGEQSTTTSTEYEDMDTDASETVTVGVETTWPKTTIVEETTQVPRIQPIWPEATQNTLPSEPSTQATLPFWMFSTQPPPRRVEETMLVNPTESKEEEEETDVAEEETTSSPIELITQGTSTTDVHQERGQNSGQKSSAASWIVAIVAVIVLGLLLLAATLFIMRYIKQSRKLHGKYNPAREEHALSAAYSMPMSHITKEERLI